MTNYQLARRIRKAYPQAGDPFNGLVASFEDAWYGSMAVDAAHYEAASRLAGKVEAAIEEVAE